MNFRQFTSRDIADLCGSRTSLLSLYFPLFSGLMYPSLSLLKLWKKLFAEISQGSGKLLSSIPLFEECSVVQSIQHMV